VFVIDLVLKVFKTQLGTEVEPTGEASLIECAFGNIFHDQHSSCSASPHFILVCNRLVPWDVVLLYIVVDLNNRDFLALDAFTKMFKGAENRVTELMELSVNCRVCSGDSKLREEPVDKTVGVA